MSQVMSSPLLAGGPAVGLAPCEEPRRALHPTPSPGLPPQYPYYTTEGWGAQVLMGPAPCKGPPSRLQQAPQAGAKASCLLPSPGEQTSGALEELDSYIDFSLESLNQMILELDPTFQLLPPGPGSPWAEPTQSTTSRRKKEEPEALDIKYIEVTSARSRCHDGPQSCSSPSVTPPFGSPRSGGLLLSRDIPWETRSSSESLIFSGSQGRGHQRPSPPAGAPSSLPPSSPSISIPSMRHKASGPPGLGSPLVASPGLEKGVGGPAPQLGGRVSVLSSSPASDVSCVFGSSQSLLHSSISSHQSSSRSLESPASSSSSLHSFGPVSSHTRSSDLQVPSNPTPSMGQPRAPHSPSLAKEHASSCPPSIANSMVDIPIVLINGQPEPGSPPCQRTRGHQDFVRPGVASSSNPCPATRSHSQTLPDAPLTTSPEEPYFGSLSAFVCQHSIMALALPCKLVIPQKELGGGDGASDPSADGRASCLKKSAGCHALYLSSVSVETLSGALAVQKAITTALETDVLPTPTVVHFKVTEQGITLTDVQRKLFFRRHYPLATLRFCGMDPEHRKWQKYCKPSWIFGFVAKSQTESQENVCHLFAEYDPVQPASQVISLVGALLQDPEKM
uniref:PID domain-containing protein n=1 Tax=Sus scrofa TaxID=9823 RepID=A0A8D1BX07_PIG